MKKEIKKEETKELEKEREYIVKYKKVSENEITVSAKDRKEAAQKAKELFSCDLKDVAVSNITKYYYIVELNNIEMMVKIK